MQPPTAIRNNIKWLEMFPYWFLIIEFYLCFDLLTFGICLQKLPRSVSNN
jgi:hypothetical protein